MTTTRLPATECPTCTKELDAASGKPGAVPDPGDVTVCVYCGEVLIIDDRYRLARCDDESIRTHPEVVKIRLVIMAAHDRGMLP